MSRRPHSPLIALAISLAAALASPTAAVDFGTPVQYTAGDFPMNSALADVTGDGVTDLIVANESSNNVSIFTGLGAGAFSPAATLIPLGESARRVTAGDLDGDGDADVAVALASGTQRVAILENNGNGTFQAPVRFGGIPSFPDAILIRDFNGDLAPDLAVGDAPSKSVFVFLGNGDGTFQAEASYAINTAGAYPSDLAAADLNGDGAIDLASTAALTTTSLVVFFNSGDGTFGDAVVLAQNNVSHTGLGLGDVNGDSHVDIVANDFVTNEPLGVRLNDGFGNFSAPVAYPVGLSTTLGTDVELADLNGDGSLDVVVVPFASGRVSVLLNDGAGNFGAPTIVLTGGSTSSVLLADADSDLDPDLVITDHIGDHAWVLRNLSDFATSAPSFADHSGSAARLGAVRPNPARGQSSIEFTLIDRSAVTLQVFDAAGRRVDTLLLEEALPAGRHQVQWDGLGSSGVPVPAGVYFVRMTTPRFAGTKKVSRLR